MKSFKLNQLMDQRSYQVSIAKWVILIVFMINGMFAFVCTQTCMGTVTHKIFIKVKRSNYVRYYVFISSSTYKVIRVR